MKKISLLVFAALVLLVTIPVYGQGGCVNSPENPTAILALVGSAGGFLVAMRGRFGRK
jgi:XrtJ-associated TM-motif-TM protein